MNKLDLVIYDSQDNMFDPIGSWKVVFYRQYYGYYIVTAAFNFE